MEIGLELPEPILAACSELFEALPMSRAMPDLVPKEARPEEVRRIAERVASGLAPTLAAGVWLYVDELHRSHEISQVIPTPTGAFWHAIMHRREGDFSNSLYWYRNAGRHEAMERVDGYSPEEFVGRVRGDAGANAADLVEMQRAEWAALFGWCAGR